MGCYILLWLPTSYSGQLGIVSRGPNSRSNMVGNDYSVCKLLYSCSAHDMSSSLVLDRVICSLCFSDGWC